MPHVATLAAAGGTFNLSMSRRLVRGITSSLSRPLNPSSKLATEPRQPSSSSSSSLRRPFSTGSKRIGLLTWGSNRYHQLGTGQWAAHEKYPVDIDAFGDENLKLVKCGPYNTAAITESGALYTWGYNQCGCLGHGIYNDENIPEPKRVEWFEGKAVKDVHLGGHFTFAITETNEVYSWGYGGGLQVGCLAQESSHELEWPTKVEFFEEHKLEQLAIADQHVVALVEGGQVYAWGKGSHGRLGYGASRSQRKPRKIDFFDFEPAIAVHAAGNSSNALTKSGHVYSWGKNESNQLGIGPRPTLDVQSMEATPVVVKGLPIPEEDRTIELASGPRHVIALTESGKVYEWGAYRTMQAEIVEPLDDYYGVGESDEKFTDFKIKKIFAGGSISAALGENSEFFLWGGTSKCLLTGHSHWSRAPILYETRFDEQWPLIRQMSIGIDHVAALYEFED